MNIKHRLLITLGTTATLFSLTASHALAHVVVTPNEAGLALRQDFTVGVPNEKEIPTTQIRLMIPGGLESVTPYVKPGWTVTMKTTGEGEEEKVTEITWSDGEISEGLRDDFVFRAMTPSEPTTLLWKAYQSYSDGTVVSWDQEPSEEVHGSESETSGPYSETKIINDLDTDETKALTTSEQITKWSAYAGLVIAILALVLTLRKKPA